MRPERKKEKGHSKAPARGQARIRRMDADKMLEQVKSLAEASLAAQGMDLVLAEFKREGGGYILRLFVDKEGGITLGDCGAVSRYVGDLLDAYTDELPPYRLEVSSPGLDRPLTKEEHFQRFAGKTALITTRTPINGRRRYRGTLEGASGGVVTLIFEDKPMEFKMADIESARLQYQHGEDTC